MKKIRLLVLLLVATQIHSAGSAVEQLRHIPVPIFGHYYSHGYHLMGGEIGIPKYCKITREQAKELTPGAVAANTPNPEFYLSIVGTRGRKVHDHAQANRDTIEQVPQPWNVLFHGWSGIANNTADNVNMGVFNIQGIRPNDLGNDRLVPLQVHPHGVYCSPNNATFRANPADAQFMTFGLVGSYKGKSIVVYQIIINNEQAQNLLEGSIGNNKMETPKILLDLLKNPQFKAHFNPANQGRLEETIARLETIIPDGAAVALTTTDYPTEDDQIERAIALSMTDMHNEGAPAADELERAIALSIADMHNEGAPAADELERAFIESARLAAEQKELERALALSMQTNTAIDDDDEDLRLGLILSTTTVGPAPPPLPTGAGAGAAAALVVKL